MNLSILKNAASMLGIDLDKQIQNLTPTIISQIDNTLADITLADGESKGLVIVPDGHGSYLIVKTVFDSDAHTHMINKGHMKLDDLVKKLTSLLN